MKLAVGFNPVIPAAEMAKVAARAEALGYDSVWVHESLYQRDVVTYLSAILSATRRIRAGSGAMNTFTRHPVAAATTFATLSEFSGGRVVMGLGLGSFPTIPLIGHKIFPVQETKPLQRMKEYVQVVREVWSGKKVAFSGQFFTVKDLELGFKLAQPVPLYIASLSPLTQRFGGSSADGVILSPTLATVKVTERMVSNVREGEDSRSRRVERCSYILTSLDQDPAKARDVVRKFYFFVYQLSEVVPPASLQPYGISEEKLAAVKAAWRKGDQAEASRLVPEEAIEALTIAGTSEAAAQRLAEYTKAGIDLPILMPIGNLEYAMERLAPGRGGG
jgi:5,10-methylenetetrahydromethanopterin reductase